VVGDNLNEHPQAVLIVAYRRHKNLAALLSICIEQGSPAIYVNLDGPATSIEIVETNQCRKVLLDFKRRYPTRIRERVWEQNLGAAHSVLAAVTWAFETEDFLIVLEDDCLPSKNFFKFIDQGKQFFVENRKCLFICGTQFAPTDVTHSKWALSSYPLIWGWATSKEKWKTLLDLLVQYEHSLRFSGEGSLSEKSFWHSGAKRSYQGFVDAWDLPLVHAMRKVGARALLPGENLVTNIGNDGVATHTKEDSQWLNLVTGELNMKETEPTIELELDYWLRKNFYRIRARHLVTNPITSILDLTGWNKRKRSPLMSRILDLY
jgi:hypothetical protein